MHDLMQQDGFVLEPAALHLCQPALRQEAQRVGLNEVQRAQHNGLAARRVAEVGVCGYHHAAQLALVSARYIDEL